MDKVEEQYSYSFDLDAYKEEVKDSLKAQGFDNELVLGLIDKANTKEGVDALVADIDLDAFNKLNEEFGQLEQKAKELNDELEALINEVEGKEEVAQEDLDAILNKVKDIRENLDKMQKHINILPSEEREKQQAELNEVKGLLDKVENFVSEVELNQAKEGALADIADLNFHTAEEKDELEAKVNGVQNVDDLAAVDEEISKAIEENDRRQTAAKESALADIADLNFHTAEEKDELEAKVNGVQNVDDLAAVDEEISKAIEENDRRQTAAKESALADIADLNFHTAEEKDELEAKVNGVQNVDDLAAVDEEISKAIEENDSRHKEAEERGLGYPQTIHVAPDNKKRSDSTDIPTLPADIVKEDEDSFHFGENLPEGFEVNPNPSWHGVEEIVFKGNDKSEEILFRLNKQNGKVEVHAGDNASYDRPNEKLPVKYIGADGTVKGFDRVSALIRPASPTDDSDQTPPEEDSGSTGADTGQGTGDQTTDQGNGGSTGEGTPDEGTTSDQDGTGSTDAGTEQGTGDQTPGQGGGDSTEDSSTDEGTTPPTDGAGEGDASSEQGTGDQAPGQGDSEGDAGSTEDGSTGENSGTTEETDPATDDKSFNPTAVDKPIIIEGSDVDGSNISNEEHDKIKKGVQNAPENAPIEIVSDVQVGEDGIARVDVEVMDPTGTSKPKIVSVPVKQNELIKQINQGLGELATHEATQPDPLEDNESDVVTVEDQAKFKNYNDTLTNKKDEIQKLLNDDANATSDKKQLTDKKRQELQEKLDKYNTINVPRTENKSELNPYNVRSSSHFSSLNNFVSGKAVSAKIGYDNDGNMLEIRPAKNRDAGIIGRAVIGSNEITLDNGDDELLVARAIEGNYKINMGGGNDRVVFSGATDDPHAGTHVNSGNSEIDGGAGRNTIVLNRERTNRQDLFMERVKNFDDISLEGKQAVVHLTLEAVKNNNLGGIRISGARNEGNSVTFAGKTGRVSDNGVTSANVGVNGWRAVQERKYNGKTYVVWRHDDAGASSEYDVWIETSLGIRK